MQTLKPVPFNSRLVTLKPQIAAFENCASGSEQKRGAYDDEQETCGVPQQSRARFQVPLGQGKEQPRGSNARPLIARQA
jgi:hypothetical protein